MTTPDQPTTSARTIDRRKVVGGLAWSVPTVAVATAAPAMAVSQDIRDRGLQGWVEISRSCSARSMTLTIDGIGSHPNRGLWVLDTLEGDVITDPYIVFYYPSSLGVLSWTAGANNSNWSVPTVTNDPVVAPAIRGYTAYVSRYSGNFRFVDVAGVDYHWAVGQPEFSATVRGRGCPSITAYARRSVTVNGEVIAFRRGPVGLG